MNSVIERISEKNAANVNPNTSLGVAREETKADKDNNQPENAPIKTFEEEVMEDVQFPDY